MISFKRLTPLLMALLMCLSLAACSSNDDPEAGGDWRTTGIVVGSGTITHGGESVDVLVTISSESAAPGRPWSRTTLPSPPMLSAIHVAITLNPQPASILTE